MCWDHSTAGVRFTYIYKINLRGKYNYVWILKLVYFKILDQFNFLFFNICVFNFFNQFLLDLFNVWYVF